MEQAKQKLAGEVESLRANLQKEIEKILEAKEVSVLLNNLNFKYEAEINKQNDSKFKIADEVTLKKLLKALAIALKQFSKRMEDRLPHLIKALLVVKGILFVFWILMIYFSLRR